MRLLLALPVLLFSSTLWAEQEGVLIHPMSKEEIVLLEKALVGRGWKILERTDSQVRAEVANVGRGVSADLLFFYDNGGFNFRGSAIKKVKRPGFSGNTPVTKRYPTDIPPKWFRLLRNDVERLRNQYGIFQRSQSGGESIDTASRLRKLQDLYENKLIDESEYQSKRAQILRDI